MHLIKDFLGRCRGKSLDVHCVGDAMIDEYYDVVVDRISPEFPMPIMRSRHALPTRIPGGVANVAYQLKNFGSRVTLFCLPDRDAERLFESCGVYCHRMPQTESAQLPVKRRFLDGETQVTRHDIEAHRCGMYRESIDGCELFMRDHLRRQTPPDVAIFSDYDKGFFQGTTVPHSFYRKPTKTIVDPKRGPLDRWSGCTVFKPNAKEAMELSGLPVPQDQAKFFKDKIGCESVVITDGGNGVRGVGPDGKFFGHYPNRKARVRSVVGAGDCFCAFFSLALGHGFSVPEAAEIAWHAGASYVEKPHKHPMTPAELSPDGVLDPADVSGLADRNYELVFTNGCFDILHQGHIDLLRFAKSKGEKLVVALNSDASVRRLKGEGRPVVPLEHRMAAVAAVRFVDYVVSFDEDTPLEIIKTIGPDVLVKGEPYTVDSVVGADIVSDVQICPKTTNISTTDLLKGRHPVVAT